MYFSRVKERQTFEIKFTIPILHCNLFSVYREHLEMPRLHLTESKDWKPKDWNWNILDGKFSKNLWPQVLSTMTR